MGLIRCQWQRARWIGKRYSAIWEGVCRSKFTWNQKITSFAHKRLLSCSPETDQAKPPWCALDWCTSARIWFKRYACPVLWSHHGKDSQNPTLQCQGRGTRTQCPTARPSSASSSSNWHLSASKSSLLRSSYTQEDGMAQLQGRIGQLENKQKTYYYELWGIKKCAKNHAMSDAFGTACKITKNCCYRTIPALKEL